VEEDATAYVDNEFYDERKYSKKDRTALTSTEKKGLQVTLLT
jgi:hypothetical protein